MEKNIQNKTQGITDMTRGNPLKLILAFAIPMLIGTLFQQFYSMVDTVMVGKYLGVNSLAAVGSTGATDFPHFQLYKQSLTRITDLKKNFKDFRYAPLQESLLR